MSEVRVNNLSNESLSGGPTISGITTFSSPYFFVPPQGDTASRPQDCPSGSLRFNTDSAKLEYYKGDTIGWVEIDATNEEMGGGTGSNTGFGTRAILMGGLKNQQPSPVATDEIDYYTISTLGNTQDFGNLSTALYGGSMSGTVASRTRGFLGGASPNPGNNIIEKLEIATTGSSMNFADMQKTRYTNANHSNQTRGLFMGGYVTPAYDSQIDYFTMATQANAIDFGDVDVNTGFNAGGGNTTRALLLGGVNMIGDVKGVIISTLGNTQDFGSLTNARHGSPGGCSSSTKVLVAGGNLQPSNSKTGNIESYITASNGTATSFGTLTASRSYGLGGCGDHVRATFGGGYTPTQVDIVDYVQFSTGGTALDFGDLQSVKRGCVAVSNGHGGL